MKLTVNSEPEMDDRLVSLSASPEMVIETMNAMDWHGFHFVTLTAPSGDWLEVSGSLDPEHGLSAMYSEASKQHVIVEPPWSIEEMIGLLLSYLRGDGRWKSDVKWS